MDKISTQLKPHCSVLIKMKAAQARPSKARQARLSAALSSGFARSRLSLRFLQLNTLSALMNVKHTPRLIIAAS